uniref:Uncharacterized protein n=1 Tax=Sclerotinia borealis TaxID=77105 RepID=A0A088CRU2_9HELO|nr:hypothetical protein SBORM_0132 [Sclerotinia borealis]AIJ56795.1 hypothetical protein SBORM_0132 [Sclerotinia borealis]
MFGPLWRIVVNQLADFAPYSTGGDGLSKRIEKSLRAILWVWTTCYKSSNCGKALKQFQPSKHSNIVCGTGNDSWYGKIEIDIRKEMGNLQPSSYTNKYRCAVHRLDVGWHYQDDSA